MWARAVLRTDITIKDTFPDAIIKKNTDAISPDAISPDAISPDAIPSSTRGGGIYGSIVDRALGFVDLERVVIESANWQS